MDDLDLLINAAKNGNVKVIKVLTSMVGFNVNAQDASGMTPLMYAAQSGNLDAIRALLETGRIEVDAKDECDRTALAYAVQSGNLEAVKALLEAGADVNAKDEYGQSIIYWACSKGNKEMIKALIDRGVDITGENAVKALGTAAHNGNVEAAQALIDAGVDVNAKNESGRTVLISVADTMGGNADVLKAVLNKGVNNINDADSYGRTALMYAVSHGNVEAVKALLEAGADINIKDKEGRTVFDYYSKDEIDKLLEDAQKGKVDKVSTKGASSQSQTGNTKSSKTVNSSAMSDRMDNWLKQVNLDPSLKKTLVQKYGEELAYKLIQQCMQSSGDAMKAMGEGWKNSKNAIEYFANLDLGEEGAIDKLAAAAKMNASAVKDSLTNSADEKGTTPLMYAAERGNVGAVEVLVDLGAGVDTKDACGCTALIWAAYNGQAEAVKALIAAKADVNVHDEYYGGTALIYAARSGNTEAVEALIVAGADVNAVDSSNQTALMFAAAKGHTEAVKALIAAKADVNVVSIDGCIALNEAVNSGNIEAVKLLLDAGADISIEDKDGKTALDYVPEGNEEMRKLLEEAKKKQAEKVSAKGVTNDEQQQPNSERDAIRAGFKKMNKEQWDALVNDYLTGSATLETDPSKGLKVDLMLERVFAGLRFEETLRSLFKDNENVDCKTSMKRSAELLGQYLQSDASDKSFEGFISFVDKAYATQETPSQTNTQARSTQRNSVPMYQPFGTGAENAAGLLAWKKRLMER